MLNFNGKKVERNGKIYLKPENTKLSFTTDRIYIRFDNLYNGNQLLSDGTNVFLNENWQDIFKEIQNSVFDAFAQIVENVMANVFNKIPYDELFAKN